MEKLTLRQKLIEMQKELSYFQKDIQGYKYSYTSGASILAEVKKLKDKYGVLLNPVILESKIDTLIEEVIDDKNKVDFLFTGNGFMVWSDENEEIKIDWYFTGKQNDPSKSFGSALTYSERYFLLKYFGIPTDELDPDKFQEKSISKKTKAVQEELLTIIKELIMNKIDGFNVITRIQSSFKKHLKIATSFKKSEIPQVIKKCIDEDLMVAYADVLIQKIKIHEKEGEK